MFAAAVLAAGIATAEVVSSDVVGYQTKSFESGFNYVANTFLSVGKTAAEMTLGDIVPADITLYTTTIQILDDLGATAVTDEYEDLGEAYLTFTYATTEDGAPSDGWYLQDDFEFAHPQNARILPFGQGYCVDSGEDATFTFAGKVVTTDTEITLSNGFNYTGNCSPANITFGDITPNNVTLYTTTIQLLDDQGATATTSEYEDLGDAYLTLTYATTEDGAPADGWYLQDDFEFAHPQTSRLLKAGQGFCVDCGEEAAIVIPSAL